MLKKIDILEKKDTVEAFFCACMCGESTCLCDCWSVAVAIVGSSFGISADTLSSQAAAIGVRV